MSVTITVKYFAALAELTTTSEEKLLIPKGSSVQDVEVIICDKYPRIKSMSYKLALDFKFVEYHFKIEKEATLAFLPPFAGG